ncbi:hypothetical protein AAHH67_15600 [Niallia circulans]
MIVIQGKNEKSKHLENLIRKEFLTEKIAIIDSIGVNHWESDEWATILKFDSMQTDELIKSFEDNYETFKKFDWVAFYANVGRDEVGDFKQLDRKYPQNFILTVQSESGITTKYYL